MRPDFHGPALLAHGFDLLLKAQLSSLQIFQSNGVGGGSTQFVFDRSLKGLVTYAKFTNTGFDGHDRGSMLDWLGK